MKALAPSRRGMTLIEMLVATTCTLVLMGAIAQVFGAFGNAVSDSRSMIEMDGQLRSVAWRLRNDLAGATARTLPPLEVEAGEGYFEIVEGPRTDGSGTLDPTTGAVLPIGPADSDDILLFTTRNTETPYLGRYDSNPTNTTTTKTTESQLAEVAWFLRPTDTQGASQQVKTYTLFRKQLLVIGYVGFAPFYGVTYENAVTQAAYPNWTTLYESFDLSATLFSNGLFSYQNPLFAPNSLADLTRSSSRFMHNPDGSPYRADGATPKTMTDFQFPANYQASPPPDGLIFDRTKASMRVGEDVVLTNVLAFDVRVFDPSVPVGVTSDMALVPGDGGPGGTGWSAAGPFSGYGAYVDLGWFGGPTTLIGPASPTGGPGQAPRFADLPNSRSGLRPANASGNRIWDSWSTHYESNGIDDDGNGPIDQGSDAIDNDSNGSIDDKLELETLPPYSTPLRGIEVRIRCYEPSSRQVRQVTIRHSFVPR